MMRLPRFLILMCCLLSAVHAANARVIEVSQRVLRSDGKAARGAKIVLHFYNAKGEWENVRTTTNARGRYFARVDVWDNNSDTRGLFSYQVIDAPKQALEIVGFPRASFNTSAAEKQFPIKLSPEYFIEGRVLWDDAEKSNRPAAGAQVSVPAMSVSYSNLGGTFPLVQYTTDKLPAELTTKTRADGTFRMRGVTGLQSSLPILGVRYDPSGGDSAPFTGTGFIGISWIDAMLAHQKNLPLKVPPVTIRAVFGTNFRGQVIDSATEQLVKNATVAVWAFSVLPVPAPQSTSFRGSFDFSDVPGSDSVTVAATAPGYEKAVVSFQKTSRENLGDNKLAASSQFQIRLRKIKQVKVHLRDFSTGEAPIAPLGLRAQLIEPMTPGPHQEGYLSMVSNDLDALSVVDGNISLPLAVGRIALQLDSSGSYETSNSYEIVEIDGRDASDDIAPSYLSKTVIIRDQDEVQNVEVKVRRRSGWFVHFQNMDAKNPYYYSVQTDPNPEFGGEMSRSGWMFFPNQLPGETLKLRIINSQTKEVVVPWTKELSQQDIEKAVEIALPPTPQNVLK